MSSATPGPLFPDAYRRRRDSAPPDYLPRLRLWALALVAAVAVWCALSWPLWHQAREGVAEKARAILVERLQPAPADPPAAR